MTTHLFVYGTLMPGQCRWGLLDPWAGGEAVADFTEGELFDTGYGWPAAVIGSAGRIPGFTIPLQADSLTMALEVLDRVEGNSFHRVKTVTQRQVSAWVYHWMGPTQGFTPIGCWEAWADD